MFKLGLIISKIKIVSRSKKLEIEFRDSFFLFVVERIDFSIGHNFYIIVLRISDIYLQITKNKVTDTFFSRLYEIIRFIIYFRATCRKFYNFLKWKDYIGNIRTFEEKRNYPSDISRKVFQLTRDSLHT